MASRYRYLASRSALCIVVGLLLYASFPPIGWWWSAVLAIALFTAVLVHPRCTVSGGLGYGMICGLALYIPLLPWISGLVGMVPWLLLASVQALFLALFGFLAVLVRRLPGWPLYIALLWPLCEWVKSSVPFGGFPWGVIGFGQTDGPLLVLASWGGAPLVSFAVAVLGTSLAALGRELSDEVIRWRSRSTGATTNGLVSPSAVVISGVMICVVLISIAVVTPQVRHIKVGTDDERDVTVAAVQGNVPRLGLDFNSQRRAVLENHVHETVRLAEEVRHSRVPQPQLVIWPENSSDIDPLTDLDAAQDISRAARAIDAPILVGTVVSHPDWTPAQPKASNTVIVWNPATGAAQRHDKQIIQPFGEYLPWRGFFEHLSDYAKRAGYFVAGDGTGVVDVAGVPVGVATCWEVIFDRAPRQSVRNGAEILAVPTNNATFNQMMSEQQLAFARLRAVEHHRYVVVAGTTGISAVIAPDGQEIARTQFFTPASLVATVQRITSLTPATRWGPLIQWVLIITALAGVVAGIRHNGWLLPGWLLPGWLPHCVHQRKTRGKPEEGLSTVMTEQIDE